ncbi:MAG: 4Fe-4S binding protein [Elusimicrobia bacterium]|nr:4Fe-4S binding protein [Elusimicrobiota bacterium]
MFKRFHVETKGAALDHEVPRIEVFRDHDRCIGCGLCGKACVYGVHGREPSLGDFTKMALPVHERCVGCHRCVNECPKSALELRAHPEFLALGDAYYTPELIETLRYEAETGRVPVSGAGYRGPFTGPGFDRLWTDMSEIVRPTRDGIHGRETISTEAHLGRRPKRLEFTLDGRVATRLPPEVRLQAPFVLLPPPFAAPLAWRKALAEALAPAAAEAGVLLVVDEDVRPVAGGMRLSSAATADPSRYRGLAFVELRDTPDAERELETIRAASDVVVSVLLRASSGAAERGLGLAKAGAGLLHLAADPHGRWSDRPDKHLLDGLRELERALVDGGLRDEVTVVASGGIARAEHAPKAILCGADAVGLDLAALVALGLRRFDGAKGFFTPEEAGLQDADRARQRALNLLNSWRDQLLEVMGAMGLREARRMQGEEGRAMFYEDLQAEFLKLFTPPARKEFDPTYG